jgi:hypothetical protein
MTDTLIAIAIAAAGSVIWFGVQVLAWSVGLRRLRGYCGVRRFVIGATIGFPLFVFFALGLGSLLGFPTGIGEFILMPLATAWILLLSWGGLRTAARIIGLSALSCQPHSAEPDSAANESQPIRSETNGTSSAAGSRR